MEIELPPLVPGAVQVITMPAAESEAVIELGAEGTQLIATEGVDVLHGPAPTGEVAAIWHTTLFETFEGFDPLPSMDELTK